MENPHEEKHVALLERMLKNVVCAFTLDSLLELVLIAAQDKCTETLTELNQSIEVYRPIYSLVFKQISLFLRSSSLLTGL